jgi:hypothetical protein
MTAVLAFLILLAILIVVYKLTNTALQHKRNVRAGARLGPGSFFLEVNDQKKDESESLKK